MPAVDQRPALAPTPRPVERPTMPRLGGHLVALTFVLLVLVPVLGRDGLFSADEGAAVAQARLLGEERGWALPHPLPEIDPEGRAFPLENASPVDRPEGSPAAAPFAKHPAYAVLLAPFDALGGVVGMTLTSVLGTVLAAGTAGLLLRRLVPAWAGAAVWVTGLATPLFFDSWLVIAHTLGAGLAGLATLSVVRAREGAGPPAVVAAGVAMAAAVLLRNEAALFGVALALGAGALAAHRRERVTGLAGAAVLAGTVGGVALDRIMSAAVAGGEAAFSGGVGVEGTSFLGTRISGALVTLVLPSYGSLGLADALLVVAVAALAGAVGVARRRPEDVDGVRLFVGLAVLAAVGRAALAPEVVPGLLMAAPGLTALLVAVRPRTFRRPEAALLGATTALFVGAVLATQYGTGGSGEWGGRYFALALPLLVPLLLLALHDLLARLPRASARPLVAGVALVSLALAVAGGRALVAAEDRSDRLVAAVDDAAAGLDDPVVVATSGAAPRFAWAEVVEGADWILVDVDELSTWLDLVAAQGRDVVLATPDPEVVETALAGWDAGPRVRPSTASAWTVQPLRRG